MVFPVIVCRNVFLKSLRIFYRVALKIITVNPTGFLLLNFFPMPLTLGEIIFC
jgi:hypothetical protein